MNVNKNMTYQCSTQQEFGFTANAEEVFLETSAGVSSEEIEFN